VFSLWINPAFTYRDCNVALRSNETLSCSLSELILLIGYLGNEQLGIILNRDEVEPGVEVELRPTVSQLLCRAHICSSWTDFFFLTFEGFLL
jgi:hypothetical protein